MRNPVNVYQMSFEGRCPNDVSVVDRYVLTVHTTHMIQVEELLAMISKLNPINFQETLTQQIAEYLESQKVPCLIIVKGTHLGVQVLSTVEVF